ncbi:anti-sigma-I factor RsgI5-like [Teleopsis dalmanni]|uniref:anti-sigma-I factor RsgI5-like n=1 Tax=Teleopsis dalmanni TaxID=139649 RepID=UPI0018CEC0B2|nr:anti-sigma-I factor RsgI5-like [Teleopsis dalmanni]
MEDNSIIQIVRQHPILYDQKHKEYNDCEKKSIVWKNIGQELKMNEKSISKRWQYLRQRFIRENRLSKENCESSQKKVIWPLYNSLLFLTDHIHERPMRQRACVRKSISPIDPLLLPEQPQSPSVTPLQSPSPTALQSPSPTSLQSSLPSSPTPLQSSVKSLSPSPSPPLSLTPSQSSTLSPTPSPSKKILNSRKRLKTQDDDDEIDAVILAAVTKYNTYCDFRMRAATQNDEVDSFGRLMMTTIRSLSKPAQTKAMHKCLNIIMEVKKKERKNN